MRHRDPCCWKWTSSVAQRSTDGSLVSLWSFFKSGLLVRIRLGDQGPRFTQPKSKLPKQPLALSNAEFNAPSSFDVGGERFAVPQVAREANLGGRLSQHLIDVHKLCLGKPPRPTRPLAVGKSCEAFFLEPAHPVGHGSRGIAQELRDLSPAHALGNEQDAVQTVIVACFRRPSDLVLKGENDGLGIGNREFLHISKVRLPH